jgi:hypothetical protein
MVAASGKTGAVDGKGGSAVHDGGFDEIRSAVRPVGGGGEIGLEVVNEHV